MDNDLQRYQRFYELLFDSLSIDTENLFVVPEHFISWNREQDLDYIAKAIKDTGRTCLLSFDSNPTCKFDPLHDRNYLEQLVQEIGSKVALLSHDLNHFFDPGPGIYFPTFLLQQRQMPDCQTGNKCYRFSFLSNNARFHRLWLYQQAKSFIDDNDCWAVHIDRDQDINRNWIKEYCIDILGYDITVTEDLPFFHAHAVDQFAKILPKDRTQVDWSNQHPAYQAVFNITGESTIEEPQVFFTEKTWKSVRSRCLTINLGNERSNQYLEKLGFVQIYDVDLPLTGKVKWICDQMARLSFSDAQEIYHQNIDAIEHNYQRFYSQELINMFRDYLHDRLNLS